MKQHNGAKHPPLQAADALATIEPVAPNHVAQECLDRARVNRSLRLPPAPPGTSTPSSAISSPPSPAAATTTTITRRGGGFSLFTVGEYAVLQTFPSAYDFHGTRTSAKKQIVSAFPPAAGAALYSPPGALAAPCRQRYDWRRRR
ncbi:hypothetical protein F4778DRAFT_785919 [Xylariomycetidae sp. FL2044]|nr:hypothetical protein F4778DRAFT_785919 [Xylariomycetidae sp. FL2044]